MIGSDIKCYYLSSPPFLVILVVVVFLIQESCRLYIVVFLFRNNACINFILIYPFFNYVVGTFLWDRLCVLVFAPKVFLASIGKDDSDCDDDSGDSDDDSDDGL